MIEVRQERGLGWTWTVHAKHYGRYAFDTADEALRDAWTFMGGKTPALIFPRSQS
jgi:hypothetical protein